MWVECLNPVWWCTSSVPARPGRLTTWAKRSVCIDRGATGAHRDGLNAAPLPYTQRTQTGFFSFPPPGWQLHKVGLIGDFFFTSSLWRSKRSCYSSPLDYKSSCWCIYFFFPHCPRLSLLGDHRTSSFGAFCLLCTAESLLEINETFHLFFSFSSSTSGRIISGCLNPVSLDFVVLLCAFNFKE